MIYVKQYVYFVSLPLALIKKMMETKLNGFQNIP